MSSHDFQIYVKQRNLVKSKIRSAQRSYEENLINKFSTAFYSYVKSKWKIEASIPHLKISNDSNDSTTSNNL